MTSKDSKTDKILEYVIKGKHFFSNPLVFGINSNFVLFSEIMSTTDDRKRESFILKNKKTIEPMVKLLAQTVISGDGDQSSQLGLNCILLISCAATEHQYDKQLCDSIINETHFILHIISDIICSKHLDQYFGILVNLTRYENSAQQIHRLCPKDFLRKLFCLLDANPLVAALITNMSQLEEIRQTVVSETEFISKMFEVFDKSTDNSVKNAIICIIRNCCLDTELHPKLLDPQNEILVKMVLPVAGPEEFDEEDTNKLPIDLQYLGTDKSRETDPEIRKLLMESLLLLCSTRFGREVIREHNIYLILREYHKWEKVREVQKAIEDVVDIIIKKEEEINEENLKSLEIPEDLIERFNKMDKELLKDEEEEVSKK